MNSVELQEALSYGVQHVGDPSVILGWATQLQQRGEFALALEALTATHDAVTALEQRRVTRQVRLSHIASHQALLNEQQTRLEKDLASAKAKLRTRDRVRSDDPDQQRVTELEAEISRVQFQRKRFDLETELLGSFLPSHMRQAEHAHHELHQKAAGMPSPRAQASYNQLTLFPIQCATQH